MDKIDNNYINKAVEDLFDALGVKDHVGENKIWSLIFNNEVEKGIQEVAKQLGLPVKINVSYISDKYDSSNTNNFESRHVVKTNNNKGSQGITAQVYIPSDLPIYGSPRMDDFIINVKISKNCLNNPDVFITVIAHELSHIVLHSILYKEKDNEIYTDITAMLLGFSKIMEKGRKDIEITKSTKNDFFSNQKIVETKTETTSYGYLSDENFNFAFNKINEILNKYKNEFSGLSDKLNEIKNDLKKDNENLSIFRNYLKNASKNMKKNIPNADALKISSFFQLGYTDDFENKNKELQKIVNKSIKNYKNYNQNNLQDYKEKVYNISTQNDCLNEKREILKKDILIFEKYISLIYKIKIIFKKIFLNKKNNNKIIII